jgi:two-component sensor histidine kinase
VDFSATLSEIAGELVKIYGDGRVKLALDLGMPFELEVAKAMPLAVLCYELLLNAMKHAWPDDRSGTLSIELKNDDGKPVLRIADDGVGYTVSQGGGFGSKLTPALAREAAAELSRESTQGQGSVALIRFKRT